MSLNIDMNIILPVKFLGVSPNFHSHVLIFSLSSNVLNLGKIFHSNSSGSLSNLSKFLSTGDVFTIPICLPMHRSIGSSRRSYQDTTQNLKRRRPFVRWRLMTLSSPIKDIYFNEWFSQPIVSNPEISLFRHLNLLICRTFVSVWDLSYLWRNVDCSGNSFPWILLNPMVQTWTFTISQNVFFSIFCDIHRRSFVSFPQLIIHFVKEWSRFHWQILIQFHRFQWQNCCGLISFWGITTGYTVQSRGFTSFARRIAQF